MDKKTIIIIILSIIITFFITKEYFSTKNNNINFSDKESINLKIKELFQIFETMQNEMKKLKD
jgi:hypothetical protein